MTDHKALIETALAKAQTDSPVHELLRDLADALEGAALTSGEDRRYIKRMEAERDAALAVIAYARACLSHDGERDYLERIYSTQNALSRSPASALAKVKADAWDEGHRACDRDWEFTADLSTPDGDREPWTNPYREREAGL